MLHADSVRLARLALPYFDDISDETEMHEYIEDAHLPEDPDRTLRDSFATALAADIHDLLHNANDEDLDWSEADVEALRTEGDYHINIAQAARETAILILGRIYNWRLHG